MALNWGETVAMKEICDFAKNNITRQEVNKLLFAANNEGNTV
jgi:hypothetical protein